MLNLRVWNHDAKKRQTEIIGTKNQKLVQT
jgi:hypothetical protein